MDSHNLENLINVMLTATALFSFTLGLVEIFGSSTNWSKITKAVCLFAIMVVSIITIIISSKVKLKHNESAHESELLELDYKRRIDSLTDASSSNTMQLLYPMHPLKLSCRLHANLLEVDIVKLRKLSKAKRTISDEGFDAEIYSVIEESTHGCITYTSNSIHYSGDLGCSCPKELVKILDHYCPYIEVNINDENTQSENYWLEPRVFDPVFQFYIRVELDEGIIETEYDFNAKLSGLPTITSLYQIPNDTVSIEVYNSIHCLEWFAMTCGPNLQTYGGYVRNYLQSPEINSKKETCTYNIPIRDLLSKSERLHRPRG